MTMKKTTCPKVSIACRTFNASGTIARAIRSVLNQTYENWELIIADDGSSDDTVAIIKQFHDERIRLHVNTSNLGPIGNLNKVFSLCSGTYIAVLDGDDFYRPTKLEKQVNFLETHPDYGAVFSYITCDAKITSNLINRPFHSREDMIREIFFYQNFLAFPTEMFRKELLVHFPEPLIATGDCNFHLQTLFKTKIKILEEPLVVYNTQGDHVSSWINNQVVDTENMLLLKTFTKLTDLELFKSTFRNYYERYGQIKSTADIPYFIARIAIETPQRSASGLYLLAELFLDDAYFNHIRQTYQVSYGDYINIRKGISQPKPKHKHKIRRFFKKILIPLKH